MTANNYLITGASSGLGKYLLDNLGGSAFQREYKEEESADVIIHCAFNMARDVDSKNLYHYLSDNLFLTKRLAKMPHKKFIYISSVDTYPKNNKKHSEDEAIDLNQVSGMYAITKLMSESIVQNFSSNYLILRCSALLGKDSRENSLTRIIKENNPTLTLSAKSIFNYVLHKDVLEFVKIAKEKDLEGIYNLASTKNINLSQIAELFGKKVNFGDYIYNVGDINNEKVCKVLSFFKKTSEEAIKEFIKLL